MKIQSQIDMEKAKQKQWEEAMTQIKEVQELAKDQREEQLQGIGDLINKLKQDQPTTSLVEALKNLITPTTENEEEKRKKAQEEKEKQQNKERLQQLIQQQKEMQQQVAAMHDANLDEESKALLAALSTGPAVPEGPQAPQNNTQQQLIDQLKRALGPKDTEDPQRVVLKHFLSKSNTIPAAGEQQHSSPNYLSS